MVAGPNATKKKWPVLRIIIISFTVLLAVAVAFFYFNINRLLSEALLKSFNSSIVADVYELKFEKLRANIFEGTMRVYNVSFQPRKKPLQDYPYINSSFQFTSEKITLIEVDIRTLLKLNKLIVKRISIYKPEVEVALHGKRHIMLPFAEKASGDSAKTITPKKSLNSIKLNEFTLTDARVHTTNSEMQREFQVNGLTITLQELKLDQQPGIYEASVNDVNLTIGSFTGNLKKGALQSIGFTDFKIGVDSIAMQFTLDTILYKFHDFYTGIHNLDIQTVDSTFHIAMKSFDVSYKDKSINLSEVSFKPNVSHAVLQKDYKFQHTEFSGSVGTIAMHHINFDSLIYAQKILIDEITIDKVKASIFKDKTKPIDSTRFPAYLGQMVAKIPVPVNVKLVKATHVELENTEKKPDSTLAKVSITRGTAEVKNITNQFIKPGLGLYADAYINDKAHFKAGIVFDYTQPRFTYEGVVEKFNMPDLNGLLQAYTPAKITKGISDEISFSGVAGNTSASGNMKFLFHNLEVDLALQDQAKWKSAVIAFAANTALINQNPASADLPPREVKFQIARDMNKGFVNVVIRSVLNGLKETMIMNKENRKTFKEDKKKAKEENKK